ncbi:MAG: S8 family serine peptidase, partial [Solirubrobacterales bacterium]
MCAGLAATIGMTTATALADFPYARAGADTTDYSDLFLGTEVPNDICGDSNEFKYSASALPDSQNGINNARPTELGGVRGAHVVDKNPPGNCGTPPFTASAKPTAWKLTTGRPDVTLAVLDSGIKWNDSGAMGDLRFKTRINKGEVPRPKGSCAGSGYDCNNDGVFNLADYTNDPRVTNVLNNDTRRVGPNGILTPQDVLIAFSDPAFDDDGKKGERDDDGNGYVDDMVGWDFLDNDNDPFDDVQYGHGTGEARGSTSEANNKAQGDNAGSCPNCMVIHMRVGNSFIADVNRFAAAVTYATDNDVQVVQSALGTLNNSTSARKAIDYAYRHGVTSILSAADEDAQHNNQPSLPHSILVNSVRDSPFPAQPGYPGKSYLTFNGCTNFNAKITLAIPSTSCSSDAVGVSSGLAGLAYSAAYTAADRGLLDDHPDRGACETVDGEPCVITPNEVRQVLASGRIGGAPQVDDINFTSPPSGGPEPSCAPPIPGCTSPFGAGNAVRALVNLNRPSLLGGPPVSESYQARAGHDQFYGYGRVNMAKALGTLLPPASADSVLPPEAEIFSPEWYEQIDPSQEQIAVEGEVFARGSDYKCEVLVAPGQYPNQARSDASPPGDFHPVGNGWCDGTVHSGTDAGEQHAGVLASINVAALKGFFPVDTQASNFTGAQPEASPATGNGRPAFAPNSFTYKVVVTTTGSPELSGEDQRMSYLHRDADMLDGFPRTATKPGTDGGQFPSGDGESSPAFADLDGDNRNELIYATSDGSVHAVRPDGTELDGWPVKGETPDFVGDHAAARGYATGNVPVQDGGANLSSVAVGDTDGNGLLEVYGADLEGRLLGWDYEGKRIFTERTNPAFSGRPLTPFANVRLNERNRIQPGFIGSPVLVDLDDDGDQELLAASMDRHLYAWEADDSNPGSPGGADALDGYPELVVDFDKVDSVDPTTHAVTFKGDADSFQQGGMIDTPAVADLDEDGKPEIVVGTNEGYEETPNTSILTNPSFQTVAATGLIDPGNTRLFALDARGDRDGNPLSRDIMFDPDGNPATKEWPVSIAFLIGNLLPIVGEGVTGSPVIGPADCPSGGSGPKIAAISYAGPGYVLNPDGSSCYGEESNGTYRVLGTDQGASSDAVDRPIIPAVGNPAFGDLTGAGNPALVIPAAGLQRALALALPENQPASQDYISAWDTVDGQFHANFPQTQNDLSFLTGPSVADIDGLPGEEVVSGSASLDLNAYNAAGVAVPGWPKLSSDWTITNPLLGSFGTLDTEGTETPSPLDGPRKVVVGMTRSGYVNAYETLAPACSPGSWPRFHHDNENSGNYERDAILPGKPTDLAAASGNLSFGAPGDDLLCGTADSYELVTSDSPIDESSFDDAEALAGAPNPGAAGSEQSFAVPTGAKRYVAIRAVDEQG